MGGKGVPTPVLPRGLLPNASAWPPRSSCAPGEVVGQGPPTHGVEVAVVGSLSSVVVV